MKQHMEHKSSLQDNKLHSRVTRLINRDSNKSLNLRLWRRNKLFKISNLQKTKISIQNMEEKKKSRKGGVFCNETLETIHKSYRNTLNTQFKNFFFISNIWNCIARGGVSPPIFGWQYMQSMQYIYIYEREHGGGKRCERFQNSRGMSDQ